MKSFDEIKKDAKYKIEVAKANIRYEFQRFKDGLYNNREVLIAAIPVVIGVAAEVRKQARQMNADTRNRREQHRHEYEVWDPRSGGYITCKRRLTNADRIRISERRADGERLIDILRDMNLI